MLGSIAAHWQLRRSDRRTLASRKLSEYERSDAGYSLNTDFSFGLPETPGERSRRASLSIGSNGCARTAEASKPERR